MSVGIVNGVPVGCGDCGAWPTTEGHQCPSTVPVPGHHEHREEQVFLRLVEWARAGREVYKAEAKGDKLERPSEIIQRAEAR